MPEPRVQQVQDGVLDTADVQPHAAVARGAVGRVHPVALDLGVDETFAVRRVEVTQVVPA